MNDNTQPIVVGTRVRCVLYYLGCGTVFRVEEGQRSEFKPATGVRTVAHAQFGIVFDNGSISEHVGESTVRGVQWTILQETASSEEIAQALASAYCARATAKVAAEIEAARDAAEVERLRGDPTFARLEQGDDQHSGKLAARNLRVELKATFPGVKFTVRKSNHGSIDIGWTDGPTAAQVKAVAGKYSGGSFDGMDDSYSYVSTPWTKVFGSAKYIFDNRNSPTRCSRRR